VDDSLAKRVPIAPGLRGTRESLELAARLAAGSLLDPMFPLWVRRKILIEPGQDPRDVPGVFKRIHDYVKANIGYQPDPLVYMDPDTGESVTDYIQSPHWSFFVEGIGDCLAHAGAVLAMSSALGHGFGFKTLRADPATPDRFSHVYGVLGYASPSGPVWIAADTTVPGGGLGVEMPDIWRFSPAFFPVTAPT